MVIIIIIIIIIISITVSEYLLELVRMELVLSSLNI